MDTALRPDEIFKLIWRDVDFQSRAITVIAQNSKNEKERIIGMTGRLFDELLRLWEISPKRLNFSVFGTKSIKTACRLAGIENLRFRDFRHTATTRMVKSEMPQAEIMKVTGHTQLKTFLRYVNLTKESAGAAGAEACISQVRHFLEAHANRYQDIGSVIAPNNRVGFRRTDAATDEVEFLTLNFE
ncbi:MAG: site-specific integrase [Pyrinomonadaceae bacterium]